jgi:hypothetical protein
MIFSARVIASATAASAAGDHPTLHPESFRAARIDAAIKRKPLPSSPPARIRPGDNCEGFNDPFGYLEPRIP